MDFILFHPAYKYFKFLHFLTESLLIADFTLSVSKSEGLHPAQRKVVNDGFLPASIALSAGLPLITTVSSLLNEGNLIFPVRLQSDQYISLRCPFSSQLYCTLVVFFLHL